jgi:hypothetical protein
MIAVMDRTKMIDTLALGLLSNVRLASGNAPESRIVAST